MSVGIWTFAFDEQPVGEVVEAAREIEELGFDSIWFGEYRGREAFTQAGLLLAATRRLTVATGIARFSERSPHAAAAAGRTLAEAHPDRFVLGLGGHLPGDRPLRRITEYLDGMDAADLSVPAAPPRRVLAALGPRMLELAATRTDGAHPYFVPPEHTAIAREALGPKGYLAVEQTVVLDPDPGAAREFVAGYVGLAAHHRANLRRLGFTDEDLTDVSDRLVSAIVTVGEQAAHDRIRAHLDAGADHVCVQVLGDGLREKWRVLAGLV
ncbi:TIGR03620 family F420-dependent LLM class oxidoreductase [Amycolatopsis sp. 195334CR]|uniref:TIGR03620 family F420-dependent LLM class oxidoreductase n=1 Tax=Amycolatopsis sp. 195334CR TaxID=2814588 RepID=UPI001A8F0102|nr:TIGR03620 family F420-dependent LLM class oxidoreductase [Amycolatopsis sp. 195334CR]MBN6033721.1 TIGR03620 family F420-dependent LLM class oxidoreductase [Amycolatopsis sp. 195334CR]